MKKSIIGCMMALPFMVACQSDLLDEAKVNYNDNSHGAELFAKAGTAFDLSGKAGTRATESGWEVDKDIIGMAWYKGASLAALENGTAYGNVPFVAQSAGGAFVAKTNMYVGNYVAYYPFDASVQSEDDLITLSIAPEQKFDAAEQYLFDTEVLLSNNFKLEKCAGHPGDHPANESGVQKLIDFKISRLNSRINMYNNVINVPTLAKVTPSSPAIPVKVKSVKIVADNLYKDVKVNFNAVPGASGMTTNGTWNGISTTGFLIKASSTQTPDVKLVYETPKEITANTTFSSKIAMPFVIDAVSDASYVVETNYGIVTVGKADVDMVKHKYLTDNSKTLAEVLASTTTADLAAQTCILTTISNDYVNVAAKNIGYDVRIDMKKAKFADQHVKNSQELMECLAIAKALKDGGAAVEPLDITLDYESGNTYFEMTKEAAEYSNNSEINHKLKAVTAANGIKMISGGEVSDLKKLDVDTNITLAEGQTWTVSSKEYDDNMTKFINEGTLNFNNFDCTATANAYDTDIENKGTMNFTGTNVITVNMVQSAATAATNVTGKTTIDNEGSTTIKAQFNTGNVTVNPSTEFVIVGNTGDEIYFGATANVSNSGKIATQGASAQGHVRNRGTIDAKAGSQTYIYDNATTSGEKARIYVANRDTKVSVSVAGKQGLIIYEWGKDTAKDGEVYTALPTDKFNTIEITTATPTKLNAIGANLVGLIVDKNVDLDWFGETGYSIEYLEVNGSVSVQRGYYLKVTWRSNITGEVNVGGTYNYGAFTTGSDSRVYNNGGTVAP